MPTKRKHRLQDEIEIWNDEVKVGDIVAYRKDMSNECVITKTRSGAYLLGDHSAVVMLEGVPGCYALDRVSKVANPSTP